MSEVFNAFIGATYNMDVPDEEINLVLNDFINNILFFFQLILNALIRFYNIKDFTSDYLISHFHNNTINLVIRGKVYECASKLISIKNSMTRRDLENKISKYKNITLSDLKVSLYFSFDKEFRSKYRKKKMSIRLVREFSNRLSKCVDNGNQNNLLEEEKDINRIGSLPYNVDPLEASIRLLRALKNIESPVKKLKHLKKIKKSFELAINDFWSDYEISNEKLLITGDITLTYMIYIIIKAEYSDIILDNDLIDTFITGADRISARGYNFTVITSSINFIINKLNDDFFKGSKNPLLIDANVPLNSEEIVNELSLNQEEEEEDNDRHQSNLDALENSLETNLKIPRTRSEDLNVEELNRVEYNYSNNFKFKNSDDFALSSNSELEEKLLYDPSKIMTYSKEANI